ncbi:MAG: HTH domain-containing protein, partial [Succinivibrionaceae bacterium]|nr:HTH domain-containing protein [Succinivibrionaceae bacterium]
GQNVPLNGQNVPLNGQNVPLNGQNVPLNGQNVPQNGQNVPLNGQNVSKEIGDIISNVPEKENIIARWNAILVCLTKDNSLSKEDIAKKLQVSPKTVQRDIAAMNDYIHVAWTGSMKNGHWEISAK